MSKTLAGNLLIRWRWPARVLVRYFGGTQNSGDLSSISSSNSTPLMNLPSRSTSPPRAGKFGDDSSSGYKNQSGARYSELNVTNALHLGERQKASNILWNFTKLGNPLRIEDFAIILDYCARYPDPLFAMETWKCMEANSIHLDQRCSRLLIQALTRGGYLKEAFDWLNFLDKSDPGIVVLSMYNVFLSGCCDTQRMVDANRCLEYMERRLSGKSEITYCELLKLAVNHKNLSAVHELWKDYATYYNPNIISLRKFIWSFTSLGDSKAAYKCLQLMVALFTQGSASVRKSATGRYQTSKLDIPIPLVSQFDDQGFMLGENDINCLFEGNFSGREDIESPVMKDYKKGGVWQMLSPVDVGVPDQNLLSKTVEGCNSWRKNIGNQIHAEREPGSLHARNVLRWSFSDIIHACARSKNSRLAEHLFEEMQGLGLRPSRHTYDGYLRAVLLDKGATHCMEVIEEMNKRSMEPYNNTLCAISTHLCESLELELAEVLLQKISFGLPKYIHAFNAFLTASATLNAPECALSILAKMKQIGLKPNICTYEVLFFLYGNVNFPYERGNFLSHLDVAKRVKTIEMDMMKNGLQHSYRSIKNLIKAFGAEGMILEMLQRLYMVEDILWEVNPYQKSAMHTLALRFLVKAEEVQRAIEVFRKMRLYDLPANVATYNYMIACCKISGCFKSACALLGLMFRYGFPPQNLTYTALIEVLLVKDDFVGALGLLELASIEGVQPDIQLFNTILRNAYFKGQIDIIEMIVEHIHREKIQPDPSTCWYTFCAYVEGGFHNTAMEALQVLSMRMISEDHNILQEYRKVFEDLVIHEDPNIESQIVGIFKQSQEFLATALLNLRMLVINGFSISWYPDESPWAKRLSSFNSGIRKLESSIVEDEYV